MKENNIKSMDLHNVKIEVLELSYSFIDSSIKKYKEKDYKIPEVNIDSGCILFFSSWSTT